MLVLISIIIISELPKKLLTAIRNKLDTLLDLYAGVKRTNFLSKKKKVSLSIILNGNYNDG